MRRNSMQCRFSFKQMSTSQALIDYTEAKVVGKIEKFSTKPIEAHITFFVEGQDQKVHCNVLGGDGFNIQVHASCPDMYGSVDVLINKLEIQLRRQKEKIKHHKHHKNNLRHLPYVQARAKDDCDSIPIDADDLIKYERARSRRVAS